MRAVLFFLLSLVVSGLTLWVFIFLFVRLVAAIRWVWRGVIRGRALYSALKDILLALASWGAAAFVLEKLAPHFVAGLLHSVAALVGATCAVLLAAGLLSESGRTDLAKSCWEAFSKHVARRGSVTDARLCARLWRAVAIEPVADGRAKLVRTLVTVFDGVTSESTFSELVKGWALPATRAEFALQLGETGEKGAFSLLCILTGDADMSVCGKAAEALGKLGDPQAIEILLTRAREWDERKLEAAAQDAVRSLGRMGPSAAGALIGLRELGIQEYSVIEALGEIDSAEAREGLLGILRDHDGSKAVRAAEKLDGIDPGWVSRNEARALIPHLIRTLFARYAHYDARKVARRYLERIDPDWPASTEAGEAVNDLVDALLNPDSGVREEALSVLGRIRDDRAAEPLINLAQRDISNPLVIRALAAQKGTRAREFLISLVYADDRRKQRIGADALSALLPPDVLREHVEEARRREEERDEAARKYREEQAMKARERAMAEFTRCLRSIAGFESPLEGIADGVPPGDDINWDNSEALQKANGLALGQLPESRAVGMAALEDLIRRHPGSAAPYGLLAQALWRAERPDEAERLLLQALPVVAEKSEIFDSLALKHKTEGEHAKATAYYLLAAYAMGLDSTLWGGVVYLSGVYRSLRPEAAGTLHELAAVMRGGNPVELDKQQGSDIADAVQSNADVRALAESAWEVFLGSKVRQMLAGYAPLPSAAGKKPAPGFHGHCQSCGKKDTAFKVMAGRAFFLCSPGCENRYGHARAEALRHRDVNVVMDTTGRLDLDRLIAGRKQMLSAAAFCWFCGAKIKIDLDVCPSCERQVDVQIS